MASFLQEFAAAISNYPFLSVTVSITDFSVIGGGVLNTGDKAQFKVNVRNTGQLDMRDVTVRVYASMYADVSKDNETFVSSPRSVPSSAMSVDAGGSQTSGWFYLKAKTVTHGAQDIVTARLDDAWHASLDHLLTGVPSPEPREDKLNKDILAT